MYKNQTQNKAVYASPPWKQWMDNILGESSIREIQSSGINGNLSQHFLTSQSFNPTLNPSRYNSEDTIITSQQQMAIHLNPPNYSIYALENKEIVDEKILIHKSQLIAFSQQFAKQRIELDNQLILISKQNIQLKNELSSMKNIIIQAKVQSEGNLTRIFQVSEFKYKQQIAQLKRKLKEDTANKSHLRQQINGQKAKNYQINKKNEFLTQKLKYQEQQISRFQHLLKIKQDIIQNFEWEKANSARRNQKKRPQMIQNQQISCSTSKIKYKFNKSNITNSMQASIRTEINQREKPSQIILNQSLGNNCPRVDSRQKMFDFRRIDSKPLKKQKQSKSRLHISLQRNIDIRNSQDYLSSHENLQSKEKLKPKSITIKRNTTQSKQLSKGQQDSEALLRTTITEKQKHVASLSRELKTSQQEYLHELNLLRKQNQQLRNRCAVLQSQSNINQYSQKQLPLQYIQNRNLLINQSQLKPQRTIKLLRQKCILLQSQIQKIIKNHILLQQRNQQLEKRINYLNSYQRKDKLQTTICLESQQDQYKPLTMKDLATPQFKQTGYNGNFFIKEKTYNQGQNVFQEIQLQMSLPKQQLFHEERLKQQNSLARHNLSKDQLYINNQKQSDLFINQTYISKSIDDQSQILANQNEIVAIEDYF